MFELIILLAAAGVLVGFSQQARDGALAGLMLAENTIVPSLTPLLIIFMLIMKTRCRDLLARVFGKIGKTLFALPHVTSPAIILGLLGGYPTGALLTKELYKNEEINSEQARRIMRFNFSGGLGFIVTAVGSSMLGSARAGWILLGSGLASSLIIGIINSLGCRAEENCMYSYSRGADIMSALNSAVESSVNSVLTITAYIVLFSALANIVPLPQAALPLLEITNGLIGERGTPLPIISAYLSFGGICIHLQLIGILREMGVPYGDFLIWRIIGAAASMTVTKILLLIFPTDIAVFYNSAESVRLSSVNAWFAVLIIAGCFVMVTDLNSKKRII